MQSEYMHGTNLFTTLSVFLAARRLNYPGMHHLPQISPLSCITDRRGDSSLLSFNAAPQISRVLMDAKLDLSGLY